MRDLADRRELPDAVMAASSRLAFSVAAFPVHMRDFALAVAERGLMEKAKRKRARIDPDWVESRILDVRQKVQGMDEGGPKGNSRNGFA